MACLSCLSPSGSPRDDREDLPSTEVAVFACDFEAGEEVAPHHHDRGQLVYVASGAARVAAEGGEWTLTPASALWVRPGAEHRIRMLERSRMRSLFLGGAAAARLPSACAFVHVSNLLRALLLRLIVADESDADAIPVARLSRMLIDELCTLAAAHGAASAPLEGAPAEQRLHALRAAFLRDPGSRDSADQWATRFGMNRKTLNRAFRRELGTTFGAWQRDVRVREAERRIADGATVTRVALDLGYESPSAFTAMFRRVTGVPPSRLLAKRLTAGRASRS